jgi:hypothetical protein
MSEKKIKVVHISQTPLVAAPNKIAASLRRIGIEATSIILNDYPKKGPLANKFIGDSLVWADADKSVLSLIHNALKSANIIHIHNDISGSPLDFIRNNCTSAAFVYQVHSPLREGPLYCERAESIGIPFSAHLVVAQYQPRHYQEYICVPNIVLDTPSVNIRKEGEKLKLLFSPSHTRAGRWNAKYSERLEKCVKYLDGLGLVDIVWPEFPLSPSELMAIRRSCHVSVDEICTGAYHQVSLEGLCAGNVVINRADHFSKAMLANCADTEEMPPFVYADEYTIENLLLKLAEDWEYTAHIQKNSYDYFCSYLNPENLVKNYENIYERII